MMIRAVDKWGLGYLRSVMRRPKVPVRHLMFCFADHFEPIGPLKRSVEDARALVRGWCARYVDAVAGLEDSDGRAPQHTFFYPQEEYDELCLDELSRMSGCGLGEVEIHLHHRNDSAEGVADKICGFKDVLHEKHGLLGCDKDGAVRYGFVHGNWALCNSRPDGDWCGVNDELGVLAGTGCYADFTFPSAPSPTQPRVVNEIYRARDRSDGEARGHDAGRTVVCGDGAGGMDGEVMLITGPLGLNWRERKWGVLPRIENGEISGSSLPGEERVKLWLRQHISVKGRPEWAFVKVHSHGCVDVNAAVVLGDVVREMHGMLKRQVGGDGVVALHYVSAREMYNIVRAAEDGVSGDDPGEYLDYEVGRPAALA